MSHSSKAQIEPASRCCSGTFRLDRQVVLDAPLEVTARMGLIIPSSNRLAKPKIRCHGTPWGRVVALTTAQRDNDSWEVR